MKEKTKLIQRRASWTIAVIIGIIVSVYLINYEAPDLKIRNESCELLSYYESFDESDVRLTLTFDKPVLSGNAKVAFYDKNERLLSTETVYFYGTSAEVSNTVYVDGKVESYEIVEYNFYDSSSIDAHQAGRITLILVLTVGLTFLIGSWTCNYKEYRYNGYKIAVYAGYYHRYMAVNGKKTDEHNTLRSLYSVSLSCTLDDGTWLKATISASNRIALKIDDLLYTETV